ncbi:protein FAM81A-like [Gigantopelta aegis]|uniref:protein FAM81A-like n=1 Tax=Gigantopelta aegis TaxID=1735272 RepID=UPI001B88BF9B|nr:protein FAM81A-like [Gigantopelta aegis]
MHVIKPKRNVLPMVRAPYDTSQEYNAIQVGNQRDRHDTPPSYAPQPSYAPPPTYVQPPMQQPQVQTQLVPIASPQIVRYEGTSRLEGIEDRLAQQEKTTQALIERAYKIKEDVIESLNFTHGSWQDEKAARAHLSDHVKNITAVVNRLNHDIAVLEESIKVRDSASVGTNHAVKNLESHHVQSLSDLRGRVVRCDTSIAKLAQDMRVVMDSCRILSNQQQELQTRIMERMHGIEGQLVQITSHIERTSGESKIKLRHLEGDTNQHLTMLDVKTRQLIEDLKNMVTNVSMTTDIERERLEQRIISLIEKAGATRDIMIEKVEKKVDDNHYLQESRIQKLEESLLEERAHVSELQAQIESHLLSKLDSDFRRQHEEIAKLKRECREGFSTVHESISNMKLVVEGKRKLLEDQLRKEISQIRKMIVLV